MPFVTTKEMLKDAQKSGIAIGAFNIENMEMAQAAVSAATETNRPIILQTTPSTLRYGSVTIFAGIVAGLAKKAPVPIALHLDHGSSFDMAKDALEAGYTSVMYDGSPFSFEENVQMTKKVVDAAKNIPVEAELGSVGGKEDDTEAEIDYTDPLKAKEFINLTGAGSLAIAIGTAHGIYPGTPKLDVQRLIEIKKKVSVPLVLHGASGLSAEVVKTCIKEGICKVNFATELRIAYSDGVKEYLRKNPDAYDPKAYGKAGYEKVRALVIEKLDMVSSV